MLPSGSPKDSNEQYKKSNAPLSFPSDGSAILISGFALAAGEIIAQRGERPFLSTECFPLQPPE